MSAPTLEARPSLTIRGTEYPVLLPKVSDPRLHLAAVIITLQVLGQTVFGFSLSIAQILVSLGTCAALEVGIAFFRQRVIMWPASALLTGNGVAFILRVPGTPHGDWWSLHGAWIFAGTAAVSLLSKHLIRYRGRHLFNPSNFGLVLCFLILGKNRADPLDFWWGPMSAWMALAVALIVVSGLAILSRLHLLHIAVGFWLTFAAGMGVLALSGHYMTARWHLGPISGWEFWRLLVTSPEILIFLFFMITDPMTIPKGRVARSAYAVGVGLVATLLIAPQTTEFATKVSVLGALAILCAVRPLVERLFPAPGSAEDRPAVWASPIIRRGRLAAGGLVLALAAAFAGAVVLAGLPARPSAAATTPAADAGRLPQVTVLHGEGVSEQMDHATVQQIAGDVVADLRDEADALRHRDLARASTGVAGAWLSDLRQQVHSADGPEVTVPVYRVAAIRLTPAPGAGQGPPTISAALRGTLRLETYRGSPPQLVRQKPATPFRRTVQLAIQDGRYVIIGSGAAGTTGEPSSPAQRIVAPTGPLAGVRLRNVAATVGLNFREGAFRFGVSNDTTAMMGGGLCWIDYDNDGWLDLFVVNSYSTSDYAAWQSRGGLPRSALFHNVKGRFVNVSRRSHADLPVRGQGCVAADLNGDGNTDLVVTTAEGVKLLWNHGNGTFSEGARAAGINAFGWFTGAAVSDVNGDGRPDLFVAGYTDLNIPNPSSTGGFPTSYAGVRDLLYLNDGHSRFREVGVQSGLEAAKPSHGLGAAFVDSNEDGRPDLYIANDEDPNQLYENVPWPGGTNADPAGLGFRFEERAAAEGVADPYAGMGIAVGDYNGDDRLDMFVTNSRREPHAAYRGGAGGFADARAGFRSALGGSSTGWGVTWADLANDGKPDLVLVNGTVPITSLKHDAGHLQILQNLTAQGDLGSFANVGHLGEAGLGTPLNGRGLAAADYDNNGTVDLAVNSIGGRLMLLRNKREAGHWLEVKPSRFTPGALVTVVLPDGRRLVRRLQAGGSYLSSEDPRAHFGLGPISSVREIIVRSPGGGETRVAGGAADRVVVVKTPASSTQRLVASASPLLANCTREQFRGRSVARVWDEAALAAGRQNGLAPPIEARDLFHLSAAMWDAWAAYDAKAKGYFVTEKQRSSDVLAARETAISYAAYRLLLWRSSYGANVGEVFDGLTATMRSLCLNPAFTSTTGSSPAALGNRIARAAIRFGQHDGSLEGRHYVDGSYVPVSAPLVVGQASGTTHDPTFWQPLAFGQIAIKGGLPIPTKVQSFLGAQWGHVRGFAGGPLDPGRPPLGTSSSARYQNAAIEVLRFTNDPRARAIANRWKGSAPIRWNRIANDVSGAGDLASNVKLLFALNGALHDAAVATWRAKRAYQSARPITMIRYLAFQGQSSDRNARAYSPSGLPLVDGLTRKSSVRGEIDVRTPHGWVLGTRWTAPWSVTPAYPGWVSDGSAFGRAAAEVLAAWTGRDTYRDAADEEGIAGVYAGTQVPADDLAGRKLGTRAGKAAWARAQRYFNGTG